MHTFGLKIIFFSEFHFLGGLGEQCTEKLEKRRIKNFLVKGKFCVPLIFH
jgi:hypothetical protein